VNTAPNYNAAIIAHNKVVTGSHIFYHNIITLSFWEVQLPHPQFLTSTIRIFEVEMLGDPGMEGRDRGQGQQAVGEE